MPLNRQPYIHGVKSISHHYHAVEITMMDARENNHRFILGLPTAGLRNLPFGGSDRASYFRVDARPYQVGGGVSRAVFLPRFGNPV